MKYLAIDPGKRNNGWAEFDAEGNPVNMGIFQDQDRLLDWLEEKDGEYTVIIERYRNRPGHSGSHWSTNETSQVIGAVARVCRKKKWSVVYQEPAHGLPAGLRFLGVYTTYYGKDRKPIKHVPDNISALAHGTYYLRRNGIQKP